MMQAGNYPNPVVVRVSSLRVLPLLLPTAAITAAAVAAVATTPSRSRVPLLLGIGVFCVLVGFLVVLAVWRPVRLRLTPAGLQSGRAFCEWSRVREVTPFGALGPALWLTLVLVSFVPPEADGPILPGARRASRTITIQCFLTMSRHRMAEVITKYQNAWAADHGRLALPGPEKVPNGSTGQGGSATATNGWQQATGEGVRMRVPADWSVLPDQTRWLPITAVGPQRDGGAPSLVLTRETVTEPDLSRWSDASVAGLRETLPGYELLDATIDEIDGRPAVVRLAAHARDDTPLTSLTWAWLTGDSGNTLTATCHTAHFAELVDVLAEAAHSVTEGVVDES